MDIDVDGLLFDDENEAKFAAHGVTVADVQEVFDFFPRFYTNLGGRRAPYVMLGPTYAGRLLLVPIERVMDQTWRPVTAFEPRPEQAAKYEEENRE